MMAELRVRAVCTCGMGWNTALETFAGSNVERAITDHIKTMADHIVTVEPYQPKYDSESENGTW